VTRGDRILGGLIAAALVVPFLALVCGLLLPFWIVVIGVVLPLAMLLDRNGRDPFALRIGRCVGMIALAPVVVAGLCAPFRLAAVLALARLPRWPALDEMARFGLAAQPRFDLAVGACGILVAAAGGYLEVRRLGTFLRTLDNLPRSRARSAAMGLAEFRGVVRRAPDRPGAAPEMVDRGEAAALGAPPPRAVLYSATVPGPGARDSGRRIWSPFHLEDETGRILVDPRGAEFWDGTGSMLAGKLFRVYLPVRIERRVLPGTAAGGRPVPILVQRLDEGDRVSVIGSVETNRQAPAGATGHERLVVRPSRELREARGLERLRAGFGARVRRSGEWHLFFLAPEHDEGRLGGLLRAAARSAAIAAAVWAALSLGLVLLRLAAW
jgi:hypothetical protein